MSRNKSVETGVKSVDFFPLLRLFVRELLQVNDIIFGGDDGAIDTRWILQVSDQQLALQEPDNSREGAKSETNHEQNDHHPS